MNKLSGPYLKHLMGQIGHCLGELMIIIILGGLGTLAGPLLGAIVFLLLEESLPMLLGAVAPAYAENWMILFGPLLIMVVLFGRGGLVGLIATRNQSTSNQKRGKAGQ